MSWKDPIQVNDLMNWLKTDYNLQFENKHHIRELILYVLTLGMIYIQKSYTI